ncbi:MAG: hypothetical protein ABFR50_00150 [Candidatus Fermentibacteria bacterium]
MGLWKIYFPTACVRIGIAMNTRETPSHHYALAHVVLRKVFRQNPVKFFDIHDLNVGTFRIRDFPGIILKSESNPEDFAFALEDRL